MQDLHDKKTHFLLCYWSQLALDQLQGHHPSSDQESFIAIPIITMLSSLETLSDSLNDTLRQNILS